MKISKTLAICIWKTTSSFEPQTKDQQLEIGLSTNIGF